MSTAIFDASILWAILPEISLVVLAGLVLLYDLIWQGSQRRALGWLTAVGLGIILVLGLVFSWPPAQPVLIFGGMLRHDWLGFVFRMAFLLAAGLTALFATDSDGLGRKGEFYLLLIAATLGMLLMASAADLIILFLAIETTSIPLYALAGFLKSDGRSSEAGFKYLLYGSTTSAVMLYGFSLFYGFTGSTQLYQIAGLLQSGQIPLAALIGLLLLVLVGFSFKTSFVPFHFWAPDVYEGAPTPVAGFLSTASKAAGFAVLMRFLLAVAPTDGILVGLLAAIAIASMTVGNLLALTQKNLKRLLAYSSIAQAGYILIGLTAAIASRDSLGVAATAYYLVAYLVTNLAAFGVIVIFSQVSGGSGIDQVAGLSRRSPWLALALLVSFLSLGGIPPFAGFMGKVLVFAAAIQSGLWWLAAIGILNSVLSLYYYLNVVKAAYLYPGEQFDQAVPVTRPWRVALLVCVAGIILAGTVFGPLFSWTQAAAAALF